MIFSIIWIIGLLAMFYCMYRIVDINMFGDRMTKFIGGPEWDEQWHRGKRLDVHATYDSYSRQIFPNVAKWKEHLKWNNA